MNDSLLCACFRPILDCVQGPSFAATASYSTLTTPLTPSVRLDVSRTGKDVVLLKEGERICGTGGSLGTVPLVQDKAYFQVTIQQTGKSLIKKNVVLGSWAVGIGNREVQLDKCSPEAHFWGIKENGDIVQNGQIVGKLDQQIEEGDMIGVTYDHIELKFYVNGKLCQPSISSVKGAVYPLIYVDESAILDVKFRNFASDIPPGYSEILVEQTLL